jgi:hypothetical protein
LLDDDLIRLCYVSEAALPDDCDPEQQIDSILRRSRSWNESVGITGALFFNRTLFAQVLEGPHREVERLFQQIKADPRHRDLIRIDWRQIETRQFSQWSMAFVGSDLSGRHRFQEMMLDERRSFELARDGMLSLLVNIVRNREDGLMAPARAEQALEALGPRIA